MQHLFGSVADCTGHVGVAAGQLGLARASALAFSFTDMQDIVLDVLPCAMRDLSIDCRHGFL